MDSLTANSFERIRSAAENVGLNWREIRSGVQASMQTPEHSGRDLGTSVTYNGDRTLVFCHNGDTEDVLDALGLEHRDLFDNPKGSEYRYDDGRIVFRSVSKKFRQDGNKQGTALFGLDSLETEGPVYVLEGENDVLTARHVCDVAAVTQAGGSNNSPAKADWTALAGRDVIIVRDDDQPGHARATKVADYLESLTESPSSVQVVDVAAGKDLSDHVAAGRGLEELIPVSCSESAEGLLPKIWKATDLDKSKPVQWVADQRVPRGMVTVEVGDEGIGKSLHWVFIIKILTTGEGFPGYGIPAGKPQHVLLLLAENGWADMDRPRMEAAGVDLDYVHVIATYSDGTGAGAFTGHTASLIEEMEEKPALIVADPWLDTVPGNLNVKDGQQAKQAIRPWRELAVRFNTGVLLVAHTNRMSSASARDKYGATAELRKTARMTLYAQIDDESGYLTIGPEKSNLVPPGQKADNFRIRSEFSPDLGSGVPVLEYVGQSEHTATDLIEEKFAVAQTAGAPETVDAKDIILEYLKFHEGSAAADDVKAYWESKNLSKPSWKTITNSRRKWGIETGQTADGWVWSIPVADPGIGKADPAPPYISGSRDLGSGQVNIVKSDPEGGQIPDPEHTGTTPPVKVPEVDEGPHVRDVGTLGSSKVRGINQDPNGARSQDPAHMGVPGSSLKPPSFALPKLSGDTELEDIIIGCLHTEYPMSLKTVEQSVPPMFRDQVADTITTLTANGLVIQDARGRYLLNSTRKASA